MNTRLPLVPRQYARREQLRNSLVAIAPCCLLVSLCASLAFAQPPSRMPSLGARPLSSPAIAQKPDASTDQSKGIMIIVRGADGSLKYRGPFDEAVSAWRLAGQRLKFQIHEVGTLTSAQSHINAARVRTSGPNEDSRATVPLVALKSPSPKECLQQTLKQISLELTRKNLQTPLWLVLIGHGTFDGKTARFNLRGRDVSAHELANWLQPVRSETVVINTASSSGAFLKPLAAPHRRLMTATQNGFERHACRFGTDLAAAIHDPQADLDKDGGVSLLEAYLQAVHRTQSAYKLDGRLATEHAVFDDNGDGHAVSPAGFDGVRPKALAAATQHPEMALPDGVRLHQLAVWPSPIQQQLTAAQKRRRDELEQAVIQLSQHKTEWTPAEYDQHLEAILLELARLYAARSSASAARAEPSPCRRFRR